MRYRSDIDGLRTVAVMSVVIFHFFPNLVPGGFIGVDVFFVISGYLISSIILKELDNGRFSILSFYKKRILRIFPALFIVLSATYLVGWFTLTQGDYSALGKHIAGGSFFISNLLLWSESGYFDTSSQLKPLLHLWSLGVEEQFYLLWPLILLAFSKTRKGIVCIGLLVLIISLTTSILTMHASSGINYYSPFTRAWELMFGALLADLKYKNKFNSNQVTNDILSICGILLITLSLCFINESMPFPGYIALLPVLGATLLIYSECGLINRVMSLKPMVYIGLISYPLYLWHWPLYSFSRIIIGDDLPATYKAALIVLCFILATLTYEFVEKWVKRNHSLPRLPPILAGLVFGAGLIGILTSSLNGLAFRSINGAFSDYTSITSPYTFFKFSENLRNGVCHSVELNVAEKNGCISHDSNQLFLWGDSYAASLYTGLYETMKAKNLKAKITQATDGNGAPFFIDSFYTDSGKSLSRANEEKLQLVAKLKPAIIVISWMSLGKNAQRNMPRAADSIIDLSRQIQSVSPSTKIFVIGPFPEWKESLLRQVIKYHSETKALPPTVTSYGLRDEPFEWDKYLQSRLTKSSITYISAINALCGESGCIIRNGNGPQNLNAVDWGHLSAAGSTLLAEKVSERLLKDLH